MSQSKKLVYLNGEFVPEADACVSVFDRGFLYGDGIFETMRAYEGRIFRLSEHIERLRRSAEIIELALNKDSGQLEDICNQLVEGNNLPNAILRISITRGPSVGGIGVSLAAEPTIVAFVRSPMPMPAEAYTEGVSAKIVSVLRMPSASVNSRIKPMNYLNFIMARSEAESSGAYEGIMLNQAGNISETSTSNIFFAGDGILVTPSLECDILPGITREVVIQLSENLGIACEQKPVAPSEIAGFQECFLTNSGVELLPLTKIDNDLIGNGKPGPIRARLHAAYQDLTRKG